jgi:hypothetical protein
MSEVMSQECGGQGLSVFTQHSVLSTQHSF